MSQYDALARTALDLIKSKGFQGTLRHFPLTSPTRDRLNGDVVASDNHVDYRIDCAVFPFTAKRGKGDSSQPGTREIASVRSLVVAGSTCPVLPLEDDLILSVEGYGPWRVNGATPLGPDGLTAIIYKLIISR